MTDQYEPVVGLEIHVELRTRSKMFCGCKNDPFGAPKPNIYTCPVCLGLPGALPVPNKKAVEWTILLGHALGCEIARFSKFDRKNYFYPDLAKGYQISQYDKPLCTGGHITTECGDVGITRVHLEEDTGKLMHTTLDGEAVSLVDFNRSGVPLVEIVTEPVIKSGEHARQFLKKLHQIVRYLGISDADMEKGSMRLEPNISVRGDYRIQNTEYRNTSLPPYKVEVKNINSFTFVKKAIEYEVARHIEILKTGTFPEQETRGWDEKKNATVSQRKKEEAHDYRYFPEPDIPPMRFTEAQIEALSTMVSPLPDALQKQLVDDDKLPVNYAQILTDTPDIYAYYIECKKRANALPVGVVSNKKIADWIINKKEWEHVTPEILVQKIAESDITTVSTDILDTVIDEVLAQQAALVSQYKSGKMQVFGPLMGFIRKKLTGSIHANVLKERLEAKLQ